MKILVDTSVWSLALGRKTPPNNLFVDELNELIKEHRVQMIGPIRQEILSGIRDETQFQTLGKHLSVFPDLELLQKITSGQRRFSILTVARAYKVQTQIF